MPPYRAPSRSPSPHPVTGGPEGELDAPFVPPPEPDAVPCYGDDDGNVIVDDDAPVAVRVEG